jgi:hypothetical protein
MDELENGYRFREPAPKTIKFMEEQIKSNQHMELAMNDMKNDIKTICNQMAENNSENKEDHKVIMEKIDNFVSTSDQKYAKKEVEIWINWALKIIVGAVLLALLGLIVVKTV